MVKRNIFGRAKWRRFRILFRQGISELRQGPAGDQPVSDYFIAFANKTAVLRRAGKSGEINISDDMLAQLAEKTGNAPVDLIFDGDSCIDLRFKVPFGKPDAMRAFIDKEVVYRSPFNKDAAIWFWIAEEKPDQTWHARAAVALRKPVEEVLAQLKNAGLPLGVVRREQKDGRFVARPDWARAQAVPLSRMGLLGSLPKLFAIPVVAGAIFFLSGIGAITVLGGDVTTLRAEVENKQTALTAQISERQAILDAAQAQSTEKLTLITAITSALSDDVVLERLRIENDEILLAGSAGSAAAVTRQIANLPNLSDIRFLSSVSRDDETGRETFEITAMIRRAAE